MPRAVLKRFEHRVRPRWAAATAPPVSIAGSIKAQQRGRRRCFFRQPAEADPRRTELPSQGHAVIMANGIAKAGPPARNSA